MSRAPRTNIKNVHLGVPKELDDKSIEAWSVDLAQALRFRTSGRVTTSGAETVTVLSITTQDNTVYGLKGFILGRRVSGSGSLNDGYCAVIRATYRVIGGTVTELAETKEFEVEDVAGFNATLAVDGEKIDVNVTGASGVEMVWFAFFQTLLGT